MLLLSIHDVSPRTEGAVDRLRERFAACVPMNRMALLVVPDHWGDAPIVRGSPFASRLRSWAEEGAEIFVHGWFHRDTCRHRTLVAHLKARTMTAREGEFLGLDRNRASALMQDGKCLLEDIIGQSVAGFIAPAWLYGAGALSALGDRGFQIAEDHWKVWQPGSGRVLAKGPVLTWASRSPARIASSLLAARALVPLLARMRVARIGMHPADIRVPAIVASIDRAVARLTETHRSGRYGELAMQRHAA
ncbi:MAG: polysaccharide deacetylase family protein [Novosphingobium sp.]|nr:polysaccharide deacetylase family protein [Novosphingobium sp.]